MFIHNTNHSIFTKPAVLSINVLELDVVISCSINADWFDCADILIGSNSLIQTYPLSVINQCSKIATGSELNSTPFINRIAGFAF